MLLKVSLRNNTGTVVGMLLKVSLRNNTGTLLSSDSVGVTWQAGRPRSSAAEHFLCPSLGLIAALYFSRHSDSTDRIIKDHLISVRVVKRMRGDSYSDDTWRPNLVTTARTAAGLDA